MKKITLILIGTLLTVGLTACNQKSDQFAVYLADTNEIIFSEEDIVYYFPKFKYFKFTEEKSAHFDPENFIGKNFIVKLGKTEVYEGSVVSAPFSLMHDEIMITFGKTGAYLHVGNLVNDEDKNKEIHDEKLITHFEESGKIKHPEPVNYF